MISPNELITTSSQRAFRECPKKYEYRYIRGYKSKATPSYFAFGTAVHVALENWYGRKGSDVVWPSDADEARGNALLRAYIDEYMLDKSRWVVKETEHQFTLEMQSGPIAGKIDMIVEDGGGDVWFVEHKTCTEAPSRDDLMLDPQFLNYTLAVSQMPINVKGWVYNGLVKPRQKPFKYETMRQYEERIYEVIKANREKYFVRYTEPITRASILLAESLSYEVNTAMSTARLLKLYPRNPYACYGMYGNTKCEFYDACRNIKKIEDLDTVEKSTKTHLELSL